MRALRLPDALTAGGAAAPSRTNAAGNVLEAVLRRTRALLRDYPRFPSLLITRDALEPQGAFAEAQAEYLQPQPQQVRAGETWVRPPWLGSHWSWAARAAQRGGPCCSACTEHRAPCTCVRLLQVDELVQLLSTKKIGVVAHFYMDPQVRRRLWARAHLLPTCRLRFHARLGRLTADARFQRTTGWGVGQSTLRCALCGVAPVGVRRCRAC